jgi:hypothetical protein
MAPGKTAPGKAASDKTAESRTGEGRSVRRTPFVAKFGAAVLALLLVRHTFGGAIRMVLQNLNLNVVWFIPDALISVGIALSFLAAFRSREPLRRNVMLLSIAFMVLPAVIGYLNGNNPLSIVSAYKIVAPLVFCMNTPFLLREMSRRYFILWCVLLAATILFLIGNQFMDYPWVGSKFSQFGVEKDMSREWYAGYLQDGTTQRVTKARLAGASVASVSAAALIVLFYCLIRTRLKSIWVELLVVVAGGYGLWLTDSKTTYICMPMIFIACNLMDPPERLRRLLRFDVKTLSQQAMSYLFLAVGIIPIIIGFSRDPIPYFAYNSFQDRINFTWPSSMLRMKEIGGDGAYLWGAGYGSFGSPAIYSGKYILTTSAVDNFMMYNFAICGLMAIALYYLCARVITKAEGTAYALFVALIPFSFATSNEGAETMLMVGLAISNIIYAHRIQYSPFKLKMKVLY